MKTASLEDRMLYYENTGKKTLMKGLPIMARLDGNNFSKFTKGLAKPFDERLSRLMIEITKYLVETSNANIGFTNSDEITLMWHSDDYNSEVYYNRKDYKMISSLAAKASVKFNRLLAEYLPEKIDEEPSFDCRIWTVPNITEATNVFLWRENNGTRNSISMAARAYFSHNKVMNKNSTEMQDMLISEYNVNWNDYPAHFKRGTFVQKRKEYKYLTEEEVSKIPDEFKPSADNRVLRNVMKELEMPIFRTVINREDVIFEKSRPIVRANG